MCFLFYCYTGKQSGYHASAHGGLSANGLSYICFKFFLEIILMSYLHLGERSWSSGYGVGLMTHGRGFNPHTGHGSLLKLRQFHLPRFALVYSAANESQHCWEGTCDGLASCPGESVQLHSNCLR